MPNTVCLSAFRDELDQLQKLGWTPNYSNTARSIFGTAGSLGGVGAGVGGLIGAGVQGYRGYRDAREQGVGVGKSLLHAGGQGMRGAGTGALIGGGVGAVGGAALGGFAPGTAGKVVGALHKQRQLPGWASWVPYSNDVVNAPKKLSDFGQRQAHWLTGAKPLAGLTDIGGERLQGAKALLEDARNTAQTGGDPLLMPKSVNKWLAQKKIPRLEKYVDAVKNRDALGGTSLPEFVSSMKEHGVGKVLGANLKEQWHGSGALGKALTYGMPAASIAAAGYGAYKGNGDNLGSAIGSGVSNAAMMAAAPHAWIGNKLIGGALNQTVGRAGSAVDNWRARRREQSRPLGPDEAQGSNVPVERHESNAYRGLPPEGGVG